MSVEYVGPEYFEELDEEFEREADGAEVFIRWIEAGFPEDVQVKEWAGPDGSGVVRMKASDVVVVASSLFGMTSLPMPNDLGAAVKRYCAANLVNPPKPQQEWLENEERVKWFAATYMLSLVARQREKNTPVPV